MKKISLSSDYLELISCTGDISTYHYKILMLLCTKPYTQTQISGKLGVKKQNIHKYVKLLKALGLIAEVRTEGRNVYLTAVTSLNDIERQLNESIQALT